MHPRLISCILFIQMFAFTAFAQTGEITKQFVDYDEKPIDNKFSMFYTETFKTSNTDVNWIRKMYYADTTEGTVASVGHSSDMQGKIKEGAFTYYYKNGSKKSEGGFVKNGKEGEWKEWNDAGSLSAVNHFKNDKKAGRNISWHDNKKISDSTILDESGNGRSFSFYDDGSKNSEGNYAAGYKSGSWIYYYHDAPNLKSIEVMYEKDSAITYTCFTEEGKVQKKDCAFEREANFKGGEDGWRKYLVKKLTAKSDIYSKLLKPGELYSVIVRFVVAKNGSIKDVYVEKKNKKQLDAMAAEIIQDSPDWIPAVQYNRKVNAYRRQPISFRGFE